MHLPYASSLPSGLNAIPSPRLKPGSTSSDWPVVRSRNVGVLPLAFETRNLPSGLKAKPGIVPSPPVSPPRENAPTFWCVSMSHRMIPPFL
jgi:hypothetical protein